MIDLTTFHPLNYIKKEEYSGSIEGMRYMLKRVSVEVEKEPLPEGTTASEEEEKAEPEYIDKILVTVWPEPLGINATPEELKTQEYFDLDADGVADAGNWINKQFFDNADKWKDALNKGLL